MRLGLEAGARTLELAVEHGIKGVPISADQLVNDGVAKTLAPLSAHGLAVCQIGAFGFNPLSPDAARREQQRAMLEKAILLAPETGCRYIVISPGNYHPDIFGVADPHNFSDEALPGMARALVPLVALAERHDVRLSIEPYLKAAINSAERFLALQALVQSAALRVNVDVTSLYDYRDLLDPRETVRRFCTLAAGHYGLAHLKEVALAPGFHIHAGLAPLGQGNTDWAEVLKLTAPHLPDDSWVILEHVQTPVEAQTSLALLRAAADRAGVTLE